MAEIQRESEPTVAQLEARRGGVLSDRDIKAEICKRGLIHDHDEERVQASCYDLRVGHVIGKRIGVEDGAKSGIRAIKVRPGELATLLSMERVKLPDNVTGLVIPRNDYAERGILILNAGYVDPGYEGHVMAQVVNLSDRDQSIKVGEAVFSLVFDYLNDQAENPYGKPPKSTDERVADLHAAAVEKADTLAISEDVLRERFVRREEFTTMLSLRGLGLLTIVGVVVAILAAFVDLKSIFKVDSNLRLTLLAVSVLASVTLAHALAAPLLVD